MLFNSYQFILFFLAVFPLHWFVFGRSRQAQNLFLLAASFLFYGWWDWRFALLLAGVVGTTFAAGQWVARQQLADDQKPRKGWVFWATLALNLGALGYFKYCNFFIQSLVDLANLFGAHLSVATLRIILPVGISFYIFTGLSYLFDVFSRKVAPTRDFAAYALYVSFFPSLLSGPISHASRQLGQYLRRREFDYHMAANGARLFLWGLFMKICIADRVSVFVDAVYATPTDFNGVMSLAAIVLYTIQIYADFAGYSYMAIGVGKLLGIDLYDNFKRPNFARSDTEFWGRWHLSLSNWFRDYVYIPLGGNRVTHRRWMLNTMVVFVVSGLWHGAAYTFLVWGAMHGAMLIVEKRVYGASAKNPPAAFTLRGAARMAFTFLFVSLCWVFFRSSDVGTALDVIGGVAAGWGSLSIRGVPGFGYRDFVIAMVCTALLFAVEFQRELRVRRLPVVDSRNACVRALGMGVALALIIVFRAGEGGSFIYFQF